MLVLDPCCSSRVLHSIGSRETYHTHRVQTYSVVVTRILLGGGRLIKSRFGSAIRQIRELRGLSQDALAE